MQANSPAIPAEHWLYRGMEDTSLNKHISPLIPHILPNRSSPTPHQGDRKDRPYHTTKRPTATVYGRGIPRGYPGGGGVGLHLLILAFDGIVMRATLFRGVPLLGTAAEVASRVTGASTSLPVN